MSTENSHSDDYRHAQYEHTDVAGHDDLLERMAEAGDDARAWSFILGDHIAEGNTKISKETAIFNMTSAHDCINRETEHCQVPWESCYAGRAERTYGTAALDYRRRQEYLWDTMTPRLFAEAFGLHNGRKRNTYTSLRVNEAGDVRCNADIIRLDAVAQRLDVPVYTYSASDWLDWTLAEHFTVNASNDRREYGDRRFRVEHESMELDDDEVWCPFDMQANGGVATEERIKCGECQLCINPDGPEVVIPIH